MRQALPRRQRGVALITAILLVAIATLITTRIAWDNQLTMRRTLTTLDQEQARHFALGAEAVAIQALNDDDNDFDWCGDSPEQQEPDIWCTDDPEQGRNPDRPPPVMDVGIGETVFGRMQGRVRDMQGKLNVNNLVSPAQGVNEEVRLQFVELMRVLRLEPQLVDALVDWIDADTVPTGAGAEDGAYTGLQPPYRPANNYLLDVSELRSVQGVDPETYAALLPHVTALPPGWCGTSGATPVNVNFATPEVLAALARNIDLGQAEAMAEQRAGQAWEDLATIPWPDQQSAQNADAYQTLTTRCFELQVLVEIGSSTLTMYSLLDRLDIGGPVVTRVRAFGLDD